MKEYDWVELITDKPRYNKEGIHKGAIGSIVNDRCIENEWLVQFIPSEVDISVAECDIKVISDTEALKRINN